MKTKQKLTIGLLFAIMTIFTIYNAPTAKSETANLNHYAEQLRVHITSVTW